MHVPHACINYIYFRGRRGVMCMCTLLRAAHSMGPAARGVSLHGVSCTMGCPWGVHGVSMGCHMYPHESMRGVTHLRMASARAHAMLRTAEMHSCLSLWEIASLQDASHAGCNGSHH